VVSLVLRDVTVIVAGILDPDAARAVGFLPAATIEDGLAIAAEVVGTPAQALVVPHALLTLPVVETGRLAEIG
jgi:hypothetical protein